MKKSRIFVLLITLLLLVTVVMAGCGEKADTSEADASTEVSADTPETDASTEVSMEDKKIVVVLKNLTNPFWVDVATGCEQAGEELGCEVEVVAPITADNNEEQIQLIEQAILDEPAAFVIAPSDSQGIRPAIEAINEAGIPIINLNTKISNDDGDLDITTFVATENYDVGYMTAEALAEEMGGEGNVVILEGVAGQQSSIDRVEGGTDVLGEYDGITIVDTQIANWKREEGMTITQNLLQKHDQIDGIFAVNAEMAIGAAEAIKQADLTGQIKIACVDVFEEIIEAIKDGRVTLTNDGVSVMQGYSAVMTAADVIMGKEVDERVKIETKIVDASNAGEYTF